MSLINNVEDNTKVIEVLIRALGTMVMEPQYQSDPNNIGGKVFITSIQKPIIEGENRQLLINKLIDIVNTL